MKKSIHLLSFILLLTFVIPTIGGISLFAQDSVRITHTQETGTLENQRFIDKYDYVFMTKEPTKWMLKFLYNNPLGLTSPTSELSVGYEQKLASNWSVGGDLYLTRFFKNNFSSEIFSRWYYDMNKRIKMGKSAGNFSGNYFGIRYYYQHSRDISPNIEYTIRNRSLAFNWGMQRRFLRHGLADLGINLGYNQHRLMSTTNSQTEQTKRNGLRLNTYWRLGLVWGDMKKRKDNIEVCDVFNCLEEENSLWKIALPSLLIASDYQHLNVSGGYEQKLFKSPFSLQLSYSTSISNVTRSIASYDWQNWLRLETRYYVLQKQRIRQGKSAGNLSGIYAGVQGGIGYYKNSYSPLDPDTKGIIHWIGPVIGLQQKLFKTGYIDIKAGIPLFPISKHFNSGPRYISPNISELKIGFAF